MDCLLNYDWPGNVRELENLATYYRTLSALPEYILRFSCSQKTAAREDQVLMAALRTIAGNTELAHGIGRSTLLHLLGRENFHVSDSKLRSLLGQMEREGLIVIGKGRAGTLITEKGLAMLRGE